MGIFTPFFCRVTLSRDGYTYGYRVGSGARKQQVCFICKFGFDVVIRGVALVDRIITGAHYGLRGWLIQRISAVLMAVYILFVVGYVALNSYFVNNSWVGLDYNTWTALFSNSMMRSFSLLFLIALFYHAWIGVRDIVMDYVKPAKVRLVIYVLLTMVLLLYVIWAVQILWGI